MLQYISAPAFTAETIVELQVVLKVEQLHGQIHSFLFDSRKIGVLISISRNKQGSKATVAKRPSFSPCVCNGPKDSMETLGRNNRK